MTPERFAAILDAYGATPARWPEAEREGARAWAATAEGQRMLGEAARLDAMLDGDAVALPGAALLHRIAATAPLPRRRRPRLWWPGFGLAATAACGALAGALIQPLAAPPPHGDGEALSYAWGNDDTIEESGI
ncbi:hypothetical protein PQ455_14375 [Sphingomonas naphthae]|uniref:Anti-sigma factor n=1 Tax=Sphingomonas naphthae TaxID=1813468 RepID=A0ABY7THX1_9SPHN|nr:hypothetical protein [Sphingomonas naphthae]WCT72812.1 hypothetical protein PQ455_14375 [Sphingomonas naphthae]